jgi:hypothetical protein
VNCCILRIALWRYPYLALQQSYSKTDQREQLRGAEAKQGAFTNHTLVSSYGASQ